jgi:hypothetical protein
MSRDIEQSLITALESGEFSPFYAVELHLHNPITSTDAPLYLWSGVGDFTSGGKTYSGVGDLLSISGIDEVAELKASGISMTLSGVPDSLLTPALSHEYSGRLCKVFFGIEGNSNLIETFTGYMDTMTITDNPESSLISVTVENVLIDLERVNPFRYTQESHASLYSGDTFFSYVNDLQDQQVDWGPA